MFTEDKESEREREECEGGPVLNSAKRQSSGKARSGGQPIDVDEEAKEKAVDATKVMKKRNLWRRRR